MTIPVERHELMSSLVGRHDVLIRQLQGLIEPPVSPNPPLVTALPTSPADGDEIVFQTAAMAAQGIAWHLRYRLGSSSIYKWEFIGGPRLGVLSSIANHDFSLSTYVSTAYNITLPLAGDYEVEIQGWGYNNTAGQVGLASYALVGQLAANDAWAAVFGVNHGNGASAAATYWPITATAAGRVLNVQAKSTAGTTRIYTFRMFARPVRLG
jgi:hypothetical protein